MRRTIVLDFDGTMTDNEKESVPFLPVYQRLFAAALDIPHDTFLKFYDQAEAAIQRAPEQYAWEYKGFAVAPAVSDPYVLAGVVFRKAVQLMNPRESKASLAARVDEVIEDVYHRAYRHTSDVFREGARSVIEHLQSLGNLVVVTNSLPDKVQDKLSTLFSGKHRVRVVGDAKKHEIYPGWNGVPESSKPPGFPRPVMLRRRKYYDAMDGLDDIAVVIGDIYEFDLSLPEAMDIPIVLLEKHQTPEWEKTYMRKHRRGYLAPSIQDIPSYVQDVLG